MNDQTAVDRDVIQRLASAGVQFTIRESFRTVAIDAEGALLMLSDPIACRAKEAAIRVEDYRLFVQAAGQVRCRALTRKGHRCKNVEDMEHDPTV
jgi:hypothetical protein